MTQLYCGQIVDWEVSWRTEFNMETEWELKNCLGWSAWECIAETAVSSCIVQALLYQSSTSLQLHTAFQKSTDVQMNPKNKKAYLRWFKFNWIILVHFQWPAISISVWRYTSHSGPVLGKEDYGRGSVRCGSELEENTSLSKLCIMNMNITSPLSYVIEN